MLPTGEMIVDGSQKAASQSEESHIRQLKSGEQ